MIVDSLFTPETTPNLTVHGHFAALAEKSASHVLLKRSAAVQRGMLFFLSPRMVARDAPPYYVASRECTIWTVQGST